MTADLNCCRHESCHATVAKRLGLRVAYATVHPDRPHVRTLHRSDDPHAMAKLATVALAATFDDPSENARAFDERRAFERCQRIAMDQGNFGETFDGLHAAATVELERLRGFTKYLVAANADTITRVAEVLAKRITLNEADIDELGSDAE